MAIAYQFQWAAVAAKSVTADCTAAGLVTVADTFGFYVLQSVTLKGAALKDFKGQVLEVISSTQLYVGAQQPGVDRRYRAQGADLSAYTLAASATIEAAQQNKKLPNPHAVGQAVLEPEPVSALRQLEVDHKGAPLDLPATPESGELAFGSITGTSSGTANTVYTLLKDSRMLSLDNCTDSDMVALIGSVQKRVPAGQCRIFDRPRIAAGTVIKVFRAGAAAAPTINAFEVYSTPAGI